MKMMKFSVSLIITKIAGFLGDFFKPGGFTCFINLVLYVKFVIPSETYFVFTMIG